MSLLRKSMQHPSSPIEAQFEPYVTQGQGQACSRAAGSINTYTVSSKELCAQVRLVSHAVARSRRGHHPISTASAKGKLDRKFSCTCGVKVRGDQETSAERQLPIEGWGALGSVISRGALILTDDSVLSQQSLGRPEGLSPFVLLLTEY